VAFGAFGSFGVLVFGFAAVAELLLPPRVVEARAAAPPRAGCEGFEPVSWRCE